MKPRIVLISQIPLWSMGNSVGGPAIHNTLRVLGQHFQVELATPRVGYVSGADLPEGVTLHEFEHHLHGLWRDVRKVGWVTDSLAWYTFQWGAWPIVRKLCERGDVDLVYGYEIYGVPVARRAADEFKIPMVARYQGTTMCFRQYERLAGLRYFKHWKALKTPADLYIMTDDGSGGDDILAALGHPPEKLFFPMNGKDLSILSEKPSNVVDALAIPEGSPLFITVCRLTTLKRVDRAIDAVAHLNRRGIDAHLAIIGVGHQEGPLRAQAAALGISDKVRFVGSVRRQELAAYYRAASGLLALGIYSNLGNPLFEAMVMGTPVFALDEGHTDHLVHHNVNGVLLKDPDPEAIAADLEDWLRRPKDLRALGERGREWITDNLWTWDERVEAEAERLNEVIARYRQS